MTTIERIKSETKTLSRVERLDLANDLLDSFIEDKVSDDFDPEFLAELERRSRLRESGEIGSRSVDEIMAGLKDRFDHP